MTQPSKVIKYCPKCGSHQFLFEGERSFKCQDCTFHFFINSSAAVAGVIINTDGEILLTVRAFEPRQGYYDLPGGFVDPMESAEEALVREIKEELNLDVEQLEYLGSFPNEYVFSNYSVYTTDFGFLCQVSDFSNIHVKDDISGYKFIKPDVIDFEKISSLSIANIIKIVCSQTTV